MVNVIGVRFENAGKLYFFTPGALWPTPGDFVIVETTRGIEFGEVVTEVREIDDTKLTSPLKQVVRIATKRTSSTTRRIRRRRRKPSPSARKRLPTTSWI